MADLRERLANDLAAMTWVDLLPHAKRDGLIWVHPDLDFLAVAVAIAEDQVAQVQHWIAEALVRKPSQEELSQWNASMDQPQPPEFQTLIVEPYVLISPLAASDQAIAH
jgi:hypothetical protein